MARNPNKVQALAGSLGLVAVLLTGCAGGHTASEQVLETMPVPAPMAPGMGYSVGDSAQAETIMVENALAGSPEAGYAAEAGAMADASMITAVSATNAREVIVRGSAFLRAPDPLAAASALAQITENAGGFVESRSETRPTEDFAASAFLVLRVPAAQMTATVEALNGLGDVTNVELSREDVTATAQDLDARIAALESSTARLTALMEGATDIEDLLRAERELSMRQGELDSLRSFRAQLSEQVAMSRLEVIIQSTEVAWSQPRTGLLGALQTGWRALVTSGQWLLVALATALPWLVALGLLYWLVRRLIQAIRNRRSTRSLSNIATVHPAEIDIIEPDD